MAPVPLQPTPRARRRTTPRGAASAAALVASGLLAVAPAAAAEYSLTLAGRANVRSDENYQQVAQEQEETHVGSLGLALDLAYLRPKLSLGLSYAPAVLWRLEEESSTSSTHGLQLEIEGTPGRRSWVRASESLLYAEELDLARVAETATVTVVPRGERLHHRFGIAVGRQLSHRLAWVMHGDHGTELFEDRDFEDSQRIGVGTGLEYDVGRDRVLDVRVGGRRYDFKERTDADALILGLGYAFPAGRDGNLRLEVGAFRVERSEATEPPPADEGGGGGEGGLEPPADEESDGWRGRVDWRFRRRNLGWSLGYEHDLTAGGGLGLLVETDNAFVGVNVPVGEQVGVNLSGHYSRSVRPEEGDEELRAAAATAGFHWAITDAVGLSGGYSWIEQESSFRQFDEVSFSRYFLGLTFGILRLGDPTLTIGEEGDEGESEDEGEGKGS